MEWILSSRVPQIDGAKFQVWLTNDQVRRVERRPYLDWASLWFTDCTHAIQNAYCSPDYIQAWRIEGSQTS